LLDLDYQFFRFKVLSAFIHLVVKSNHMKHVTRNIRKLRIDRELSQENVAFNLKISQSSYAKMESGQSRLSINRLYQLAVFFNVPIEELLKM
jgi:DNA-binding XRE family transcriptional regulator